MKYKEWLIEWLDNYVKPLAKPKTYTRYSEIIDQHLIPKLEEYDIQDISPIVIQRYITELLQSGNLKNGEGLSSNSVNMMITVIQNSLKVAFNLGYVESYSGDKIIRPKIKEKEIASFTSVEQKKIEEAVMSDKRCKMFGIILCFYTGLRIGELLALEWDDVDFSNKEIHITKTCYDSNKDGKYQRQVNEPKTDFSVRSIPIPKQLVPYLKELKKKNNSKWVVGDGDKVIPIRSYQASFSILLRDLDIPHRGFHSLRHTFATRSIECGMDVKTLSEILGHKNPTVTLKRYAHSLIGHKRAMMNLVGKLL